MIGGIGRTSFSWFNPAAMNDFKLAQALANKPNIPSVSPVQKPSLYPGVSQQFLKEYRQNFTDLEKMASELAQTGKNSPFEQLGATSANGDIVQAQLKGNKTKEGIYTIDVQQLAQAQVNTSKSYASDKIPGTGGKIVLETSQGSFELEIDASQAESSQEVFEAIAEEINGLEAGVTASVVKKDGAYALSVTSAETGIENAFTISGDYAQELGLDTAAQMAQDAVYTIGREGDILGPETYTSGSNNAKFGEMELQLKQTGSTTIEVGTDIDAVADKVEKLVKQYTDTMNFLEKNMGRSPGVAKQLQKMMSLPVSYKSMQAVGISLTANGYTFDREKFAKAYEKNPSLVEDVISGSHGFAAGVEKDAQDGLRAESSLSVPQAGQQGGIRPPQPGDIYDRQALTMLSTYNKTGVYNLSNYYAVGAMLNMFA